MYKIHNKIWFRILIFILPFQSSLFSQINIIEFDSDKWNLVNAEQTEYLGRKALRGFAILKDVEFKNGVIEYDIAVDGSRSYPGIVFRMQSMENYENFYIRPHASNWANALQYTPVINSEAGWQLYNGDGFTALAKIPTEQWIHVKIEIKGSQAKVFFNNSEQPVLEIHELKHGLSKGSIGIRSSKFEKAYYSNFTYQLTDDLNFDKHPKPDPVMGIIRDWELSQTFAYSEMGHELYPNDNFLKQVKWQKVTSEPGGLVDICRYSPRSKNGEPNFILAKTIIYAENDEIREFAFGYSDIINVFINKDLIFSGTNSYRSRSAFFQGIVGLNDIIYLPLKKGENELLFYIAETFGGWGFMCQDAKTIFEHKSLTKEWEISSSLKFPESVVYDKKRDMLYVSNFFSGGNEFISRIKLNGEIDKLDWVSGLMRPTGLCINEDKLYAVNRRGIAEINIDSAKIINTYPVPGAAFLNDITSDETGNLYVSDNVANKIFKFNEGKFEVWLEDKDIIKPNGILCDGNQLIVGTSGDGCLKVVNLSDKKISTLACFGSGSIMDGIQKEGNENYLISDYNGRIFRVSKTGQKTELLNRTAPQKTCADFDYIPDKKLLVIPSLYDNRLTCYKITK